MIWIAFAALTAAAVLCVLVPLLRRATVETPAGAALGFYQAQVEAIKGDSATGLISAEDAAIAETEAARRLLAGKLGMVTANSSRTPVFVAAALAVVAIPALAVAMYLHTGSPDLPDLPLDGRKIAGSPGEDMAPLVAKMEKYLAQNPDDGKALLLIAPVYLKTGRAQEAANAYGRALALLGETGKLRADFAEALVAAANGQVTPEAEKSLQMALKADPEQPKVRFYLGIGAEQAGDKAKALEIFNKLVADAKADASYLPYVRRHIAELAGQESPPPPPAGMNALPQGADIVAALPDAERQAMIRSMVDGLASKLAASSHDGEG